MNLYLRSSCAWRGPLQTILGRGADHSRLCLSVVSFQTGRWNSPTTRIASAAISPGRTASFVNLDLALISATFYCLKNNLLFPASRVGCGVSAGSSAGPVSAASDAVTIDLLSKHDPTLAEGNLVLSAGVCPKCRELSPIVVKLDQAGVHSMLHWRGRPDNSCRRRMCRSRISSSCAPRSGGSRAVRYSVARV